LFKRNLGPELALGLLVAIVEQPGQVLKRSLLPAELAAPFHATVKRDEAH
jgi:hypothetical protein